MKIDEFSKTGLLLTQTEITHIRGGVTCICIRELCGNEVDSIFNSGIYSNSEIAFLDTLKGVCYGIVTKKKVIADRGKWADFADRSTCKTICCGDKLPGYLWEIEGSNPIHC